MPTLFTSESVSPGHPDKVCDHISDAVVDAALEQDSGSRVACETTVKDQLVTVQGEITSKAKLVYEELVRGVISDIGYNDPELGFDAKGAKLLIYTSQQSPDIAQGVNRADPMAQGAGDQGLMFGYASNETPELMPLAISKAHALMRRVNEAREQGEIPYLRPDAKSQVTVEYGVDGSPARIHTVVLSVQHHPDASPKQIEDDMRSQVIDLICGDLTDARTKYHINPTGRFVTGGPVGDAGVTGRKIIVDSYGGYARHGGGAFSGKDPSKVDRSAAYAGRYVAKNIVAAGLAAKCEVQIAYAIGVAEPVSIHVETFGTGTIPDAALDEIVGQTFDLRPAAIIQDLKLLTPQYRLLGKGYGHMGREDLDVSWEHTDRTGDLLAKA